MVKNSTKREYRQVVFLNGALSVLEALNSGGEHELTDSLKSLAETHSCPPMDPSPLLYSRE